jgi:uncharacterized DUF497 family protein
MPMRYNFEWDPEKAKRNIRKHKVIGLELYRQGKQQNQKPNNIDGEY